MSYLFKPDHYYRMPTHFGPSLGPRQGLNARCYACVDAPDDVTVEAIFEGKKSEIAKLLPPGFSVRKPYTVTLSFSYITNIEWLAGRGYNTFGVTVPATYNGVEGAVHGEFLLVLWENMAEPIITGREELGFSKIYCEIPEPRYEEDGIICSASWDGFEFASLRFQNLQDITVDKLLKDTRGYDSSEGTLHYKYIPKTGCPGEVDAEYAVLTPGDWPNQSIDKAMLADSACIQFNRGSWQQLPTLITIVEILSQLTLGDCISAFLLKMHGGKDISDQRILR